MNEAEKTAIANELLTTQEVVDEIFEGKVAYGTLLLMVRRGELPAKKIGIKYFFSRKALEKWKEKSLTTPNWAG